MRGCPRVVCAGTFELTVLVVLKALLGRVGGLIVIGGSMATRSTALLAMMPMRPPLLA